MDIDKWLDQPADSGITRMPYRLLKGLLFTGLAGLAVYGANELWTYLSRQWQVPRPEVVTERDYFHWGDERDHNFEGSQIVMNVRGRMELRQTASGLEVTLEDADGFYPESEFSNPTVEVYGMAPTEFVHRLAVRTWFCQNQQQKCIFLKLDFLREIIM